MTEEVQGRKRKRMRLWLAVAAIMAILAVLIVPPLVSISRFKSRITQLMSVSLGRPVRLSSVELRLLPVPGFVLTDLTVEEDPAYGAEPVLHAGTVTANVRQPPRPSLRRVVQGRATRFRCRIWRRPTRGSTSKAGRRSCRFRW